MWNLATLFPMTLAACVATAAAQPDKRHPGPEPDARIKIGLHFSVAELDPSKPGESFLECQIQNCTDKSLRVPTVYMGGYRDADMRLFGGPLRLVYWAGKKEQKLVELHPGKTATVFKAELGKLLLLDAKDHKPLKPGEPRYYWSWDR